jgi:hypothetical protein
MQQLVDQIPNWWRWGGEIHIYHNINEQDSTNNSKCSALSLNIVNWILVF